MNTHQIKSASTFLVPPLSSFLAAMFGHSGTLPTVAQLVKYCDLKFITTPLLTHMHQPALQLCL